MVSNTFFGLQPFSAKKARTQGVNIATESIFSSDKNVYRVEIGATRKPGDGGVKIVRGLNTRTTDTLARNFCA